MSGKQRHSKCSKWLPFARIHASSLFRHWSTTSSHDRPPCCAEIEPMSQQMLPQLVRIADWYSIYALLQHSPDAVIYRLEVRSVGWPHVRSGLVNCDVHCAETRLSHKHDVLAHCLKTNTFPATLQIAVAASASATRLGNTARWFLLQAQWGWGWYSRVWLLQ